MMPTRRQFLAGAVAASVALAHPLKSWSHDVAPIAIGLVGPMTGPNALNGQLMREGAETAISYINAKGGIHGKPVELIIEDDAGDPKQAVTAANNLASRAPSIALVVGHATSSTTIPASSVYIENQIPLLAPVNADALTANPSPFVFRIIPPNKNYATHVAEEILSSDKRNIAIVHNGTEYGRGFADLLKTDLNQQHVQEIFFEASQIGERDFSALISKFKNSRINAVALALYPHEAGLIIRQALDQGFITQGTSPANNPLWLGHSLLASPEFYKTAGSASNGTRVVSVTGCDDAILQQEGKQNADMAGIFSHFKKRGITKIDVSHTIIFSALQVASQALSLAASRPSSDLSTILHSNSFKTMRGSLVFETDGNLRKPDQFLALYEIQSSGPHFIKKFS